MCHTTAATPPLVPLQDGSQSQGARGADGLWLASPGQGAAAAAWPASSARKQAPRSMNHRGRANGGRRPRRSARAARCRATGGRARWSTCGTCHVAPKRQGEGDMPRGTKRQGEEGMPRGSKRRKERERTGCSGRDGRRARGEQRRTRQGGWPGRGRWTTRWRREEGKRARQSRGDGSAPQAPGWHT